MKRALIALAVAVILALPVSAQENQGFFMRDAVGVKSYAAAPRLAERAAMVPAVVLPAAATTIPEAITAIADWNASGREPMRNGFRRMLPDVIDMHLSSAIAAKSAITAFGRGVVETTNHGTIVWSTTVRVDDAHRIRLHLENVMLPEGAALWVYGGGQTPIGFGRELLDGNGSLWTPSVPGGVVYLDVEVPASNAAASFSIREILELIDVGVGVIHANDAPTCLVDATCVSSSTFPQISIARKAVASLFFVTSDGGAVCTGGLLNDQASSGTPFLLTANHCFHDQSSASSLEAVFDFQTSSCQGNFNRNTSPTVNGATWLVSSSTSDFTLVRLNSIPAGRFLLGWNSSTSVVPSGTTLHRVSHPVPASDIFPQSYSNTSVDTSTGTCSGFPRSNFIYSSSAGGQGGVYGGSSGSPVMLANGQVVGQLLGSCGPDPSAGCDVRNSTVDGAFSSSFTSLSPFLTGSGATPTVCTQNATTMCLADGRFAVSATWRTNDGNNGNGQAVRLTSDTGYFTFFSASNVEAVVKVLNACGLNQKFWVFAGGLTNVNVVLTIRDTKNGTTKTYTNPQNTAFQPIQDTNAFATCP
ncbi:MAG TPA: trypsin-like peptidase domain-containing protein [Thermoanaerobaculia bacterium]|nr:trypsin-like peptidase domain-containing protein [Thermoanaerobaculia bacterium]